MNSKTLQIINEFRRYLLVGVLSFLGDISTLILLKEYLIRNHQYSLYISVVIGFLIGTIINYTLSVRFVFISAQRFNSGRKTKDVIIFVLIGIMGLMINELGIYIGVEWFRINYLAVKVMLTGVVLVWNFCVRKYFVFSDIQTS